MKREMHKSTVAGGVFKTALPATHTDRNISNNSEELSNTPNDGIWTLIEQ